MSLEVLKSIFSKINEESLLPEKLFEDIHKEIDFDVTDDDKFYQPIYVGYDNFDKRHDSSMDVPIYYNDFDFNVESDREEILSLMRTNYSDNEFSTIASCNCGTYRGNHYTGTNFVCPECGTPVVKPLSSNFTTKVWLRTPAKVSGFINPSIYSTFLSQLTTKTPKLEIVKFWIDKKTRDEEIKKLKIKKPKLLDQIEAFRESLGISYGYNSFIENIDLIVTELLNAKFIGLSGKEREDGFEYWSRYKDCAISKYFPVPNKIMMIIEHDGRGTYYTKEQLDVEKQFQTIADLYKDDDERSVKNEELIGPIFIKLINALANLCKHTIYGKYGSIRYSAGAGRLPYTGRTIISGQSTVCRSDTVVLPWIFVVTALDKHLLSWLYRKGYTPVKARKVIVNAANKICPIVLEFVEWIENNKYIMVTIGRQPSIVYLSARSMFAVFNRDIDDLSMRIPITTSKPFGADFDGKLDCRL